MSEIKREGAPCHVEYHNISEQCNEKAVLDPEYCFRQQFALALGDYKLTPADFDFLNKKCQGCPKLRVAAGTIDPTIASAPRESRIKKLLRRLGF